MRRLSKLLTTVLCGGFLAIAAASRSDDVTWWSERPLVRPEVPAVEDTGWSEHPIDRFIVARLSAAGLPPNPRADRATLIRRATYDLTGLPPTPEEVASFVADDSSDAWERLVDRLLESPQYGEKWGRHWLDLVRFAETDSYERDRLKPNAWKYRDYVIESFNADKPYDQFIIEQLAGDEVDHPTVETIVATGFYRLGIWDDEPADVLQAQYDDLDGIVATTSQVFLGMSLNCARCHDHKKDPIPQRDYYRFLSFFENIKPYKEGGGNAPTPANYLKTIPVDLGATEFDETVRAYHVRRESLLKYIDSVKSRVSHDADASAAAEDHVVVLTFDKGPTDTSPSGRFDVTVESAPASIAGRNGKALAFDGQDDALVIPRAVEDDFTISFWFRTEHEGPGGTDHRWFLGAGLVDGEVPGIVRDFGVAYHSDGRITAGVGKPETFIASPPGYHDGVWHHAAFTRSRTTGEIALYVDGEEVDRATGSNDALNRPESLTIGRSHAGGRHYRGELDDVRIDDRVLDDGEILNLVYDGGFTAAEFEAVRAQLGEEEHRRYRQHVDELTSLKRPVQEQTEVLCVQEHGPTPPDSFIHVRGNANVMGDPVSPGFPEILTAQEPVLLSAHSDAETSMRRRTLAEWIASPDNGRTARVIANRIWQYHFGRGLSPTPNDFGRLGEKPTHPDLLDWLAVEFVEGGWSFKRMHKLIMMSQTYQMSSAGNAEALAYDPQNTLFWRYDMRRLTAEEIRDSILAVNGTLNLRMGGPGVYPPMPTEVLATSSRPGEAWGRSSPEDAARRSIYIHVKRSLLMPILESFDMADTDSTCPVRFVTTQPTQALTMMNSEFTNEQAHVLADRLRQERPGDVRAQVTRCIELVTQRPALDAEADQGIALIESLMDVDGLDAAEALDMFCLVALNLNEFVYLD